MAVRALSVGVGAILVASSAMADPVRVKAGAPGVVAAHIVLKENSCEAGPLPDLRITDQPKHGTARVMPVQAPANTPQCSGRKVRYAAIVYVPAAGYRGSDTLSYGFEYDIYINETGKRWIAKSVEITVE